MPPPSMLAARVLNRHRTPGSPGLPPPTQAPYYISRLSPSTTRKELAVPFSVMCPVVLRTLKSPESTQWAALQACGCLYVNTQNVFCDRRPKVCLVSSHGANHKKIFIFFFRRAEMEHHVYPGNPGVPCCAFGLGCSRQHLVSCACTARLAMDARGVKEHVAQSQRHHFGTEYVPTMEPRGSEPTIRPTYSHRNIKRLPLTAAIVWVPRELHSDTAVTDF